MTHWTERMYVENPDWRLPGLEESEFAEGGDEDVDEILTLLEEIYDVTPEKVLDVGCGPLGRHVIPFAARGIEAHGLDISPAFVERAATQAEAAGVADTTSFFTRDMREIAQLTAHYDVLISHYTFSFYDEDTNEAILESFHDRLNPGGILLITANNKEGMLVNFKEDSNNTVGEVTYVRENQYDPLTSIQHEEAFVIANETVQGDYESDVRLYTPIEMKQMFARTGFEDIHLFETLDREALTRESESQVILGRK